MTRRITSGTTLDHLRTDARRWLRGIRRGDEAAQERYRLAWPAGPRQPTLRDVQHALAHELGFPGWTALRYRLDPTAPLRRYERIAAALVTAYHDEHSADLRIVHDYFGHLRPWEGMRRYVRLALGRSEVPTPGLPDTISREEAQLLVARAQGFPDWRALVVHAAGVPAGSPRVTIKVIAAHTNDGTDDEPPSDVVRTHDWDELLTVIGERGLEVLDAHGQMTDDLLARASRLESVTTLRLGGSSALGDEGIRHLVRMPNLRHLDLSGCAVTDRGLGVLRLLPCLESFTLQWSGVTDAGAAHLVGCRALRRVDLGGSPTGDGAIAALAGMEKLHDFRSGTRVTDSGLARLREFPRFARWHGGETTMDLLGFDAGPTFLLLRGPFTDHGMAALADLEGLAALNVDDRALGLSGAALRPLARLPHFEWLAFDATDESMEEIAALPGLRFLMCQDSTAGDDGFSALARSGTLEYLWGRRTHRLGAKGFRALSTMPALAHLSTSCLNVPDEALAAFPDFPALVELMPMDVPDAGYRHIARCDRLERLVLMYCRETGDEATAHITRLPRLRSYFASYTRITDRTPALLAGMATLERITFDSCIGLTDRGVAALAALPRLERLDVGGMPHVTAAVAARFPPGVRVRHSI